MSGVSRISKIYPDWQRMKLTKQGYIMQRALAINDIAMEVAKASRRSDTGALKKMLTAQPEMAPTLACGVRAIVCNDTSFGDFASIMIVGTEDATPEIVMSKTELIRFAHEILTKLEVEK